MNRDALEHLFEEEMNCSWREFGDGSHPDQDGYLIRTSTLSPNVLKEIAACGATVRSFPGEWFRVFNDTRMERDVHER